MNYMTMGVFFKEKQKNWQVEKITQVKRSNAPFFIILQMTMSIVILYRAL